MDFPIPAEFWWSTEILIGDPDQNLVSLAVTFDVFKMTLLKIVILMYFLETNIVNIYQDRMLN